LAVGCMVGFWFILKKLEHSLGHVLDIYVHETCGGKGGTTVFSQIRKYGEVLCFIKHQDLNEP
jgi:hypothetical protein